MEKLLEEMYETSDEQALRELQRRFWFMECIVDHGHHPLILRDIYLKYKRLDLVPKSAFYCELFFSSYAKHQEKINLKELQIIMDLTFRMP